MRELLINTLMSQYATSPRITSFIMGVGEALDTTKINKDFFDMVVNLKTAQGFGLDIWGRIVGIGRAVHGVDPQGEYFGFEDGFYPFNDQPFYSGLVSDSWDLTDDAYRELILMKAMSNIIYATAPNINRLLWALFGRNAYFLALGDMRGRYVLEFHINAFERHIIYNTDILPRPCGVYIDIIIDLDTNETFGFSGTGLQPFGEGVFYDGSARYT